MAKLRIVALGGLDENGKNLYALEINDDIIVVNCGLKYPEESQYGVEVIVPDYEYLKNHRHRIKGLVLTHAHDDMMNGVPYLLRSISIPVYGPEMCQRVLKVLMKPEEYEKMEYHILPRSGSTAIGNINVTTFGLTHSTAGALGVAFETEHGQVVIAEQFVVDFNMHDQGFDSDISTIAEIGDKNVLCLLMEASYAEKPDFTSPKHRITNHIRPYFEDDSRRIVISLYDQNFIRFKEIVALCREYRRKIYLHSANYANRIRILSEMEYLSIPQKMFLSQKEFNNDRRDTVVIVTGNRHDVFEVMNKVATKEDDVVELRETDTVIIASPIVPGSEKRASAMEDELYKDNVMVVKLDPKLVLSVHPSMEDMKLMLSLLRPKYFLPVMGEYRDFIQAANLAIDVGYTPDRIIILDNGQVAYFNKGNLISCSDFIKVGETMVGEDDGKSITSFVIKDRETLSTDGVIIIGVAINYNNKELIAGPDIQSRGVIYVKDSEYIIKNIARMTLDIIAQKVADGTYDNMSARAELREQVSYYVLRETGKRPMILPAILEINLPVQ